MPVRVLVWSHTSLLWLHSLSESKPSSHCACTTHSPSYHAPLPSCSLWMTYGCLKPDNMVLFVNLIGDLLQLFYILVYQTYAEDKVSHLPQHYSFSYSSQTYFPPSLPLLSSPLSPSLPPPLPPSLPPTQYGIRRDFTIAVAIVLPIVLYYSIFVSEMSTILTQLGIICNFFTICFFASPLSTMVSPSFPFSPSVPLLLTPLFLSLPSLL